MLCWRMCIDTRKKMHCFYLKGITGFYFRHKDKCNSVGHVLIGKTGIFRIPRKYFFQPHWFSYLLSTGWSCTNSSLVPLPNIRSCFNIVLETLHVWKYALDFFRVKKQEIKNKVINRVSESQGPNSHGVPVCVTTCSDYGSPYCGVMSSPVTFPVARVGWADTQSNLKFNLSTQNEWKFGKFLRIFSMWVPNQCSWEEYLFLLWVF